MSAEVGREACPCCPVPSRLCARAPRCLRLVWSVLSCGGSVLCVSVSHARALSAPPPVSSNIYIPPVPVPVAVPVPVNQRLF